MKSNTIGLKALVYIVVGIVFLSLVSLPGGAFAATQKFKGQKLTVLIWGSGWDDSVQYVASQFEKEYGVKVNHVAQSSAAEGLLKLQGMKNKPTVDVWCSTPAAVTRAEPGLIADVDPEKIYVKDDLIPGAIQKKYVAWLYYPYGIVYREDMVSKPITGWEDLWSPEMKGKVGIPSPTFYDGAFLIISSYLNGGDERNIEPGFQKIKEILPNTVTVFTSDATARTILAQGEVAAIPGPADYYAFLQDRGIPAKMVAAKPSPLKFDVMAVVKGGKEDLAHEFISFMNDVMAQEKTIVAWKLMPVNKKVPPAEELKGIVPKFEDMVVFDQKVINENLPKWVERWNREIVK